MDVLALSLGVFWAHWLWPILLLVVGLGGVIFFHELGHFVVAKCVGIKVERFALGFGPRLIGNSFSIPNRTARLLQGQSPAVSTILARSGFAST